MFEEKPQNPIILVYKTTLADESITLPTKEYTKLKVDWGDGSEKETFTNNSIIPKHSYANVNEYTVIITSKFKHFSYTPENTSNLIKITSWGDASFGITDMTNALKAASNTLVSIADDTNNAFEKVTSFDYAFYGIQCSVPDNLFKYNTEVTDFSDCFNGCTNLLSDSLQGVFEDCPLVTNFSGCFNACTSITEIPEGLFDNNPLVTDFGATFGYCIELTTIPINLFDKNTKVTSFGDTFERDIKLSSSIPYDTLSGLQVPTPLYERSNVVNGYEIVTKYDNCFGGCHNVKDYDMIPEVWKTRLTEI